MQLGNCVAVFINTLRIARSDVVEAQNKCEKADAAMVEARSKVEVAEAEAKCLKEALDKAEAFKTKVEADLASEKKWRVRHRPRSPKLRRRSKAKSSRSGA